MNSQYQLQFASLNHSGLSRLDQTLADRSQAVNLFRKQYFRSAWHTICSAASGSRATLRRLKQDIQGKEITSRQYLGVRAVPIRAIVGSESRSLDFDERFRPRRMANRDRWLTIAAAYLTGVSLPPVELIQIGDAFYVRDGHHRISVAQALGQETIDAEIVLWAIS